MYRHQALTCAHKTLPFGTLLQVSRGTKSIVLRVTDRGPFIPGRDLDVSGAAAVWLGMTGVHKVRVRVYRAKVRSYLQKQKLLIYPLSLH